MARQWDEQIRQERAAERARRAEERARKAEIARVAEEERRRDQRELEQARVKIAELEARLLALEEEQNRAANTGDFEVFLRSIEQWSNFDGRVNEQSEIRTKLHMLREFAYWLERKIENPAHRHATEQVEMYRPEVESMLH